MLSSSLVSELTPTGNGPLVPPMATIQIIGGRKEKIRAGDVLGALSKQFDSTEIYHGASLGFMERTANATEETAQNTAAALSYLDAMLKATTTSGSGTVDEDLGRRVSVDRRLNGVSVV